MIPIGRCKAERRKLKQVHIIFMIAAVVRVPKIVIRLFEPHQIDLDMERFLVCFGTKIDVVRHTVQRIDIFERWCMWTDGGVVEPEVGRVKLVWEMDGTVRAAGLSGPAGKSLKLALIDHWQAGPSSGRGC